MKTVKLILPFLCLLIVACRQVPTIDVGNQKMGESLQNQMIGANRVIAQSEEQQIDAYVGRRGWQMVRTKDGVRLMETACPLSARKIAAEDEVVVEYRLEALNGKVIYDSRCDTVTVGRLKPTRGLDSALRLLHYGSTARVIVPSEQAYGVLGDGDRIGSRMVLVYELKVKNI